MDVSTLTKRLTLSISPINAYKCLSNNGEKAATALLETAEAGTHQNPKSMLLISSAVEIRCRNKEVICKALNSNGSEFLAEFDLERSQDNLQGNLLQSFDVERSEYAIQLKLKPFKSSDNQERKLREPSTLDVLKAIAEQASASHNVGDEQGVLMGAFSFDLVDQFEAVSGVEKKQDDYVFYLADQLLFQDKNTHSAEILVKGFGSNVANQFALGQELAKIEKLLLEHEKRYAEMLINKPIGELVASRKVKKANSSRSTINDETFKQMVVKAKDHIVAGDAFQVVLSRDFEVPCANPMLSYEFLRESNPSPYMYYFNFGKEQLFGASPESALKINKDKISIYPIAGTRKRGFKNEKICSEKDAKIEIELIQDEKENAEHMMLLDLARNDIARVIKPGSREITQLKKVVKYSKVMHLVSEVVGELKDDVCPLLAYRACANMGTLTGAPKIKALDIIRGQESKGRGFYGGAVAVIKGNNDFDSAIIIRSAQVKSGTAIITAGAGVVYDSNPDDESKETYNKSHAVIEACNKASAVDDDGRVVL